MSKSTQAFLAALRPIVASLGATVVTNDEAEDGDQPIVWHGSIVAHLRSAELHGALERSVQVVEREVGAGLADMDRAQKQQAIRRLDELGAFLLRGAVEDIAGFMGVSKVTLYSYLNAIKINETNSA